MASLIRGYEYDIFISYRHNDNLDGWVSDFVQNLEKELKGTIKEPISIYFDTNPHDGLLETHDVDSSLKDKIKCLVFIPIVSQTYCDTNAFAWRHEFLSFLDFSKTDNLGLEIKLPGGNVTKRVLPISIHEIDVTDKNLFEAEICGVMRPVNFIFKSSGVNRPLSSSDKREENFNKTLYRDQINKVANAIREIIRGLKESENSTNSNESPISQPMKLPFRKKLAARNVLRASLVYILTALVFWKVIVISSGLLNMTENFIELVTLMLIVLFPFAILLAWLYERSPGGFVRTNSDASLENPFDNAKKKPFTSFTFIILLIVTSLALFLIFPMVSKEVSMKSTANFEKSIAVLPFENDSQDMGNAYFINGLMDEILTNLQKIKGFSRVLSRTSTERYKGPDKPPISLIAKELGVNYLVEGSGQKYGNKFRLHVQLIAAKKERRLWSNTYTQEIRETNDIFNLQSIIAQSIASELKATITHDEKQLIEKLPTSNLMALDYYQRGEDEMAKIRWPEKKPEIVKRAEIYYRKALEYDSTFAQAYAGLAGVCMKKTEFVVPPVKYVDSMLVYSNIALSYDDRLAEAYFTRARYFVLKGKIKQAIEDCDRVIRLNPNNAWAYKIKGWAYQKYDPVGCIENYQKSLSLDHDSTSADPLIGIGWQYINFGFPEKGIQYLSEAVKLTGDTISYYDNLSWVTGALKGDFNKTRRYWEEKFLKDSTDLNAIGGLAWMNYYLGNFGESFKYFRKAMASGSNDSTLIYDIIGFEYLQSGYRKEAEYYFRRQIEIYNNLIKSGGRVKADMYFSLARNYACRGDTKKAYEYLKLCYKDQRLTVDQVTFLKTDPILNSLRNEPEFQKIVRDVEAKYQAEHERVRKWLEEQGQL
jgi:TolB-like protein/tetratricopeptide (TPR) repeat protein